MSLAQGKFLTRDDIADKMDLETKKQGILSTWEQGTASRYRDSDHSKAGIATFS